MLSALRPQTGEPFLARGEILLGARQRGAAFRLGLNDVGTPASQELAHRRDHEADDDDQIDGEVDRGEQQIAERRRVMVRIAVRFGVVMSRISPWPAAAS